ncbi:putative cytochrome P450 304a1 [Rhizoctonia solani]|uniref:Putative cytochrome P450 304a1 n=1 Tax=Rhizoctonia solani TaxID=456999 RepID=A0A0K6G383_9AGAM|nr:putative cytochrome P450 304a1 [Rhizoctonia solani]
MFNNWLNARAVTQFHQLQEHQARMMLQRLVDVVGDPYPFQKVKNALFRNAASSTLQLAYGYTLEGDSDVIFQNLDQMAHLGAVAAMFTNFFVNIFPSLIYVPEWFPGTGWKQTAREWRALKDRAQTAPYEWTKAQLAAGTAKPSILGMLLQGHSLTSDLSTAEKEARLKELTSMIVAGKSTGTEITSTTLVAFVAAMVLNPDVQAKAQKEIDGVLGPMSLPTLADRERLPYICNLVQEVLRWSPAVPTGVPHSCWQDDTYRGYDIERGTIVVGNIWAMTRDERTYENPEVFNPDRFLDPNVPRAPAFGWGRRKCPGIYFAEASLFITAASLLTTFNFMKKKAASGNDIVPQLEAVSNSVVVELKPFEFQLELRSDQHRQLILEYNSV